MGEMFRTDRPLAELLKNGTRVIWPPAEDRRAWEGIAQDYRQ